jgi:hypothetical protein
MGNQGRIIVPGHGRLMPPGGGGQAVQNDAADPCCATGPPDLLGRLYFFAGTGIPWLGVHSHTVCGVTTTSNTLAFWPWPDVAFETRQYSPLLGVTRGFYTFCYPAATTQELLDAYLTFTYKTADYFGTGKLVRIVDQGGMPAPFWNKTIGGQDICECHQQWKWAWCRSGTPDQLRSAQYMLGCSDAAGWSEPYAYQWHHPDDDMVYALNWFSAPASGGGEVMGVYDVLLHFRVAGHYTSLGPMITAAWSGGQLLEAYLQFFVPALYMSGCGLASTPGCGYWVGQKIGLSEAVSAGGVMGTTLFPSTHQPNGFEGPLVTLYNQQDGLTTCETADKVFSSATLDEGTWRAEHTIRPLIAFATV